MVFIRWGTITGIGTGGRGMTRSGIRSGIPGGDCIALTGTIIGVIGALGDLVGDRVMSMWTQLQELGNLHPQDLISGLRTVRDSGLAVAPAVVWA